VNDTISVSFVKQIDWCAKMGSRLYADLLTVALADLDSGGPVSTVVSAFEGDAVSAALPLRLMGGIHRLVLSNMADALAAHFPTVGGSPDDQRLGDDFLDVVASNQSYLIDALDVAPQTNEIGRSAALLPGLGYAMGEDRFPLRLLEIGSSAGLNLLLDRYNYRSAGWDWDGLPNAPTIDFDWTGSQPPLPAGLEVASRRGCDLAPLDAAAPTERIRLLSFVWADHVARFERMRGALALMAESGIHLDRADAAQWVAAKLGERVDDGTMTVLQHSVMWMYLPQETREAVLQAVQEAGMAATRTRPFAHVRFEAAPGGYDAAGHRLTVTRWPGGANHVLATGHAHGAWIAWDG
jgi:hypothetical protein